MKIDCSKTENYLKEKARMTNNCKIGCSNCPFCCSNNGYNLGCSSFENTHIKEAIEIVQKWSDEHLKKTWADKLAEMLPNMSQYAKGVIMFNLSPFEIFGTKAKEQVWNDCCEEE